MPLNVNSGNINCDNLYSEPNANPSYDYSSSTNQSSINSSTAAVYSRSQNYSFCTYNNKGCTTPPSAAYANISSLKACGINTAPPTTFGNTSGINTTGTITSPPTTFGNTSGINPSGTITPPPTTSANKSGINTSGVNTPPPTSHTGEKTNPKDYTNRTGRSTAPPTTEGIPTAPPTSIGGGTPQINTAPPISNSGTSTTGTTNSSNDNTNYIDDEISSLSIHDGDKLDHDGRMKIGMWLNELGYNVKIIQQSPYSDVDESSFLSAIEKFQYDHHLVTTGKPNLNTIDAIHNEWIKRMGNFTPAQLTSLGFQNVNVSMVMSLNDTLKKYGITTTKQIQYFLAVCLHESKNGLSEKYNGDPDEYFNKKYGGRLGNVEPGDPRRFRGAGYIQLTGRNNYQDFADTFKDESIKNKIMTQGADYVYKNLAWEAAGFWWDDNNMNKIIADGSEQKQDNIVTLKQISNAVNRGPKNKYSELDPIGWDDRKECYKAVCNYLN